MRKEKHKELQGIADTLPLVEIPKQVKVTKKGKYLPQWVLDLFKKENPDYRINPQKEYWYFETVQEPVDHKKELVKSYYAEGQAGVDKYVQEVYDHVKEVAEEARKKKLRAKSQLPPMNLDTI